MAKVGAMAVLSLLILACSPSTGPSVKFAQPTPTPQQVDGEAANTEGTQSVDGFASAEVSSADPLAVEAVAGSDLGFVQDREVIGIANGSRVPLGEDRVAEVFLAPYPPDWNTDMHLFLMDKETFEPVTDINVDMIYDMVFMEHGIDAALGTKIDDGHYLIPLSFLMYGDWNVDVTMDLPEEGKKHLRFIVKFFP